MNAIHRAEVPACQTLKKSPNTEMKKREGHLD
ncbi:unknown protein [Simkania negevensis Z]|uniref:Uncharacterized protein n=1 Tax=Simkania negevensis (strain ATCC VR-1471 / DSM 27360 / Z) TaxID=331113 RepID=F8L7T8_SIMNZ|nr:unknown protein [Simkania negevensis Z]